MRRSQFLFSTLVGIFLFLWLWPPAAEGQSRRERRAAAVAESAKPRAVAGGEQITVARSYDATYDAVLTHLKKNDHIIEQADRDIGQIFTGLEITGGWRQKGTRWVVTLIKENEEETIVKVAVTQQKRYKALQTEPWSDPKLLPEESKTVAKALRKALVGDGEQNQDG